MTKILIKRLSKEVALPRYETNGSSGMDLEAYINTEITIMPGKTAIISTGLAISIPKGFEVQIRPRSGLAAKQKVSVLNTPGTIDSDYRGEIKVILINHGDESFKIEKGHRIAQMNANGWTLGNYGMVWGHRLISPDYPFTEAQSFGQQAWRKAVVMMTDGINTMHSNYTAYGPTRDHNIRPSDLNDRFAEVCQNLKDEGVTAQY